MALSVVQNTKGHDSGFNNSVTTAAFGSSTTSGNTIAVVVSADSGSSDITSVTDSNSNTYTKVTGSGAYSSGGAVGVEVWYSQNITGGASHTVTANDSGFVVGVVIAYELAGLPTTGNIIDVVNTGTGSSGSQATGNLVTTNANDIIVAGAVLSTTVANTWTAGTSFTLVSDVGTSAGVNTAAETRIVSSTGTYTGNMTSSVTNQSWAATAVAFSDTVIAGSHSYTSTQTATLSFTGGMAKRTNYPWTASLSFAGAIAKRTNYPVSATLRFTGAIAKVTSRNLVATLNFAGSAVKAAQRSLPAASLSFAGGVAKRSAKTLSAGLSFIGAATTFAAHNKSLTATMSFAGTLNKTVGYPLRANSSFSGSLAKATIYPLSAAVGLAGSVGKTMMLAITTFFAVIPFSQSVWYAGSHSTNVSGNTGWDFTA